MGKWMQINLNKDLTLKKFICPKNNNYLEKIFKRKKAILDDEPQGNKERRILEAIMKAIIWTIKPLLE